MNINRSKHTCWYLFPHVVKINLTMKLTVILILISSFGAMASESNSEEAMRSTRMNDIIIEETQGTISGRVVDAKGQPLPGVAIAVKGTTKGTTTDFDGHFQLDVPDDAKMLIFSFVGMKKKEVKIDGRTSLEVVLEEDTIGLDEVVAVGYGTMRKADLTGSVATVSEEEIESNSYANVMQGLQGRIPGVNITSDGSPVSNVNVQIRGLTSLSSAPPLIIIDDLPTTMNLRDINPQDIASIQVLKDAASASIYGSRAASGVIIIETKKGKKGKPVVSYNGSFGVSSFMNRIEMMNTQQYGTALWQAAINDGLDPNTQTQIYTYDWEYQDGKAVLNKVTPVEWLNPEHTMRSADTDWFKAGTQLGLQNNHQLTASSGTDNTKTLFSLNYYENQGTQIYTMFRRFSARLNSEYKLGDRLTIGENLSIANIKLNDQNVTHQFMTMPSIVPVYDENGGWGGSAYSLGMDDYNNPVRILTLNKDNFDYSNKLIGSVYASLKLFKGLTFKTLYGIDYSTQQFRKIDFIWQEAGGRANVTDRVRSFRMNTSTTTWTNTLRYNLESGKHRFDALAGTEMVLYSTERLYGTREDILIEDYDYAYLDAATGNQAVSGIGDEWSLLSYFSKLNYVYNDKYLLSAILRYDGSSKFGENNKFGFFPSVSAGWRISEEPFLKDNPLIYNLKLRASWGMNGNSNIPTYGLVNLYRAGYDQTAYPMAGNETGLLYSGYYKFHTGNPDLKWESTEQVNIGFDFGLLYGVITGSFDYFYKYTNGMLYELEAPAVAGEGSLQWVNAADMSNKGFEFILTYAMKKGKDFSYAITGNISSYKNRIDNLPESAVYQYGGNGLDDNILGRPLNSFYGFIADGLFKTQDEVDNSPEQAGKGLGRIRYKDLDGDGRITWEHDRTWIGCSDPDFSYGLNFSAKYKDFDFNMFWQGIVGNIVKNDWKTYSDFWNVWTQHGFNHATRLLGGWTPDNPESTIPALSLQDPNDEKRVSTYFMESGSYLKLRNIQLGYTLPVALTSKAGIKQCRLSLTAQNIISLKKWWGDNAYTGIDPENPTKSNEYSSPYARPQVFLLGVDISF